MKDFHLIFVKTDSENDSNFQPCPNDSSELFVRSFKDDSSGNVCQNYYPLIDQQSKEEEQNEYLANEISEYELENCYELTDDEEKKRNPLNKGEALVQKKFYQRMPYTRKERKFRKNQNNKDKEFLDLIKFKTELCRYWINGNCHFGENCKFAHGEQELGMKFGINSSYKTKKCKRFFNNHFCEFGQRCFFLHSNLGNPRLSYSESLEQFSSLLYHRIIALGKADLYHFPHTGKQRLPIFLKISKNSKLV